MIAYTRYEIPNTKYEYFGDRPMVGQQTLDLFILVQIQVPEQNFEFFKKNKAREKKYARRKNII